MELIIHVNMINGNFLYSKTHLLSARNNTSRTTSNHPNLSGATHAKEPGLGLSYFVILMANLKYRGQKHLELGPGDGILTMLF